MSAFLVATYTITDAEGYAPYPAAVAPTLIPFGGELMVADFESEAVEGKPYPVTVIVRFPSKEEARQWHGSQTYQDIIRLRTDHTQGTVVFVDEWQDVA